MQLQPLDIAGAYLLENFVATDHRGTFVKTFHADIFAAHGLDTQFQEGYHSVSGPNVLRGMHFQLPPHDHAKLVYAVAGRILDVILDLRADSPTYGKSLGIQLDSFRQSVYIPRGCAHGFAALDAHNIVMYLVSSVYTPEADAGIRWDSFGFDWPVKNPVLSDRDAAFGTLANFKSPF